MRGVTERGTAILVGALLAMGIAATAQAGVNVGVSVNIGPPPIVVPAPPELVMIPRVGVYFVPGVDFDVFFYNGYWWSPRGDRWYRARAYNGPWRVIERRYVPGQVVRVPRGYRETYVRERHIPYGEWRERHYRGERREMRDRHEMRERGGYREEFGGHGEGGHGHGR